MDQVKWLTGLRLPNHLCTEILAPMFRRTMISAQTKWANTGPCKNRGIFFFFFFLLNTNDLQIFEINAESSVGKVFIAQKLETNYPHTSPLNLDKNGQTSFNILNCVWQRKVSLPSLFPDCIKETKNHRFYGKIPGIWLSDHLPLFLRASSDMVGLC